MTSSFVASSQQVFQCGSVFMLGLRTRCLTFPNIFTIFWIFFSVKLSCLGFPVFIYRVYMNLMSLVISLVLQIVDFDIFNLGRSWWSGEFCLT